MELIEINNTPINTQDIYNKITSKTAGSVMTFSGVVRQENKISYLFYEAYKPLAIKQCQNISQQIKLKFAVQKIAIIHRLGKILPGESSLFVALATTHRKASFLALEFCIEKIKQQVTIWKKEVFESGEHLWKANKK